MRSIVFLEGAIGCGKSSIINACPDAFACVRENLDVWRTVGYPMLAYQDPQAHGWNFQSLVLATQQHDLAAALQTDAQIIVVERSVVSNAIFAELMHEDGTISDLQMSIYRQQHKAAELAMTSLCAGATVHHIWLDVSPEECLKRLTHRNKTNQDGESAVSLQYMQRLYEKHRVRFAQPTKLGPVKCMGNPSIDSVVQSLFFTRPE